MTADMLLENNGSAPGGLRRLGMAESSVFSTCWLAWSHFYWQRNVGEEWT